MLYPCLTEDIKGRKNLVGVACNLSRIKYLSYNFSYRIKSNAAKINYGLS